MNDRSFPPFNGGRFPIPGPAFFPGKKKPFILEEGMATKMKGKKGVTFFLCRIMTLNCKELMKKL